MQSHSKAMPGVPESQAPRLFWLQGFSSSSIGCYLSRPLGHRLRNDRPTKVKGQATLTAQREHQSELRQHHRLDWMPGKPSTKGKMVNSQSSRVYIWSEREESCGPSLLPTFVRVIQLEDIWVFRVIGQLHHPAYDGDLLSRCRFILEKSNKHLGGLGPHPALRKGD